MNVNEVNNRFLMSVEKLGLNGYKINQAIPEFKEMTFSRIKKGEQVISVKFAAPYCEYFSISMDWILFGRGNMLNSDTVNFEEENDSDHLIIDNEEDYEKAIEQGLKLLPEVNFKFSAGQTQLLNATEDITRYWYLPDCKDCEGVAQVVGSSMTPALPAGCWVALKKYTLPNENPNTIPFGNIFGVVLEDKATGEYHGHIKVLRRYKEQELSRKYWIAHSINKDEFDDFDIEIAQVKSLWIVKQHIVSDILL